MRNVRTGALALLLTFLPAVAVAQDSPQQEEGGRPERAMGGMMQMHRGGMMMGHGGERMAAMGMMMAGPMMRPGPATILRHEQSLALDETQVERLQALEKSLAEARETRMKEMRTLRGQLGELRAAEELDLGKYESLLEQIADHQVAVQVEAARVGQQALGVLSEEQRGKLGSGMSMMREQGMMGGMGGMRGGMMGDMSGMQGGMMGGKSGMKGSGMSPASCPMGRSGPADGAG